MCITDPKSPTQGQCHKIVSEIYCSRIHEADGWRDAAFHRTFFFSVTVKLRKNLGISNVFFISISYAAYFEANDFPEDVWMPTGS